MSRVFRSTFVSFGIRNFSISTVRNTQTQYVHVKHEFHDIIKWNRPAFLKSYDVQVSCDTRQLPKLDPATIRLEYRPFIEIIEKLPKEDQKLFTVALGRRKDTTNVIMEDTCNLTKRHKYDTESPEFKVAKYTVKIRNFQVMFAGNPKMCKGKAKSLCRESIQKRHKFLTQLKNQDVKKFEWILEVLGLIFKPLPEFWQMLTRKTALTKLTTIFCNELKSKRLFEYKLELESQKIPFLEEKLATLKQIKADEDWMKLPCSVEPDIEETIRRIEYLKNNPVELKPIEPLEIIPTKHVPYRLFRVGEVPGRVWY